MNSSTISHLLKRGISPSHDPVRFMHEAENYEKEKRRDDSTRRSQNSVRGKTKTLELSTPIDIHRWQDGAGRAIRLGHLRKIELWEGSNEIFLLVEKYDHIQESYRVRLEGERYILIHRIC